MAQNMSRLVFSLSSGVGAGLAAVTAIMALSRLEGRPAVRPVNATSHVLWGKRAAQCDTVDLRHTATGLAINFGSALFWGGVFALTAPAGPRPPVWKVVMKAYATSLFAAVIDYKLVPKRLRPGWELALNGRGIALAFAAMGTGLAGGGLAATRLGPRDRSRLTR